MTQLNPSTTIRITALWAFSEAFLGGVLHGFKLPFAGLALAPVAALCMSLIAVCNTRRGVILKATLIVIAVKFILSPQTPLMAYAAVMIEGLAGELFHLQKKYKAGSTFLLTVFCLLYSAFQRLIVLTLVFGTKFWEALDVFLNGITKTFVKQPQQYSLYIVVLYISCYLLAGIIGGIINRKIILSIQSGAMPDSLHAALERLKEKDTEPIGKPQVIGKNRNRKIILGGLLLLLLILSYFPMFAQAGLDHKALPIIIRGLLILLVWNYLFSPLITRWIGNWVRKFKVQEKGKLQQVLSLLPHVKAIVQISWQSSTTKRPVKKFSSFLVTAAMLIIYEKS